MTKEELIAENARLTDRVSMLENALTPSGETKTAYMSEITFPVQTGWDEYGSENYTEVTLPWVEMKKFMSIIMHHATPVTTAENSNE